MGVNTMTTSISGYAIDKSLPDGVLEDNTTIGSITPEPGSFTTLTSTGAFTPGGDITLANGKALKTDTTTAHTAIIQAYDVDGTAYKTFATLTNGNTPSFAIAAPSGGTVAIDGATIGGTTPAAATVTALTQTGAGTNIFNSSSLDTDFTVKAITSGNAINYDAGTSALTFASTTIGLTGAVSVTGAASTTTTMTSGTYFLRSVDNALTAVGTNRATALQLAKQVNNITTAAASTGVILPVGVIGMRITVFNAGANAAQVYASASETIDGVAGSTGVPLTNAKRCDYFFVATNTWISAQLGVVSA